LAVSFTNKAADEMRERVSRLCVGGIARGVMLSTFHALGLLILKSEQAVLGMPTGFSVYDTSDQLGVIREILRHAHMDGRKLEVKSIASRISRAKNAGLTPQDFITQVRKARFVSEYDGFTAEVYPRYVERMRALHALDFDDLLVETLRLLREEERVRSRWQTRFRYLMIDEYQGHQPLSARAAAAALSSAWQPGGGRR
jgi:superfamily I DNA/RNA helicase